jgi:myo-inositol 2-dehydrogenase / D-chiro-inositol 1-dehydrogenase
MGGRIRVGLIGAGRIGRRHAQTLAGLIPQAELALIADASSDAAREVAESLRIENWTTDPYAVFGDETIKAIVISSSTDTHSPFIIAAARAGKDVFCEKPIALDLESTDAALDAVENSGVRLQIGFQRRFDKGFRRAKQMIEEGAIGKVEAIRDTMRDPSPAPRDYIATCGGLYRDMVIHNFDNVRWLAGSEVDEMFAMGAVLVDPMFEEFSDIDTSVVSLRFESGALGTIDNSRRAGFGYDVRTEVFGSEGAIFIGYSRDTPILHLTQDGVKSDHVHWFLERFDQAYIDELKDFVQAIVDNRPPAVNGADGRAAMALAYAAEASRREQRPFKVETFSRRQSE